MLAKSVLILLLSVSLHYIVNAQSGSCSDLELGKPQNFVSHVDYYLFLSWMPPSGFGSCQVSYILHIQNMNTSEYLIPIQYQTSLNYVFNYNAYGKHCVYARTIVYASYNSQTSLNFASNDIFLDPVIELGPPAYLFLINTERNLNIYWSAPIGFETCVYYIMYWLTISLKDSGQYMISFPMTGYYDNYVFAYPEGHPLYCQEVNVTVQAQFRGQRSSITESVIFGPPGYCKRINEEAI